MKKEFREFWIDRLSVDTNEALTYEVGEVLPKSFSLIHVIEKSAYDQQVKAADELEKMRREEQLARQDAQDKLKIAAEILDYIVMEIGIIGDDLSGHMEQNLERAKKFLKEYANRTQAQKAVKDD